MSIINQTKRVEMKMLRKSGNWLERLKLKDFLYDFSYSRRKSLVVILSIVAIAQLVVQLSIFKNDLLIVGGDMFLPLSPALEAYHSLFVWNSRIATGIYVSASANLVPYLTLLVLFNSLMGLPVSERILFGYVLSMSGLSAYYLVITLLDLAKERSNKYLAGFVASVFYMFNTYTLQLWAAPEFLYLSSFALTPLLLALFIKGLETRRLRYALVFATSSLLFASAGTSPVFVVLIFIPILTFFFFYMLVSLLRRDRSAAIGCVLFTAITLATYVGVNSFWIIPMIGWIPYAQASVAFWNPLEWLEWKSRCASVFNIIRMISFVGWWEGPTYGFASFYTTNLLGRTVGFVFPALALVGMLIKRNRYTFFFFSLVALGVFLAEGVHPPLGFIYRWLYLHVPGFWIFRSVEWFVHLVVLGYSFLIGVLVSTVYAWERAEKDPSHTKCSRNIRRFGSKLFAVLIVFLLLAYPWPFWTGAVVHSGKVAGEVGHSYYVKVPKYYYEAADWINSQPEGFRILSLPLSGSYVDYKWGYGGSDIVPTLFNKPIVDDYYGDEHIRRLTGFVSLLLERNESKPIGKLLGLINVKYILFHNDADPEYGHYGQVPIEYVRAVVRSQDGIYLEKVFGQLEFYRNKYFVQAACAATDVRLTSKSPWNVVSGAWEASSENIVAGHSGMLVTAREYLNFTATAKMRLGRFSLDDWLIWGVVNRNNFYYAGMAGRTYFTVGRFTEGLRNEVYSRPNAYPPSGDVYVKVVISAGYCQVFSSKDGVNWAAEYGFKDNAYSAGKIGIYAGQSAEFSNVKVLSPSGIVLLNGSFGNLTMLGSLFSSDFVSGKSVLFDANQLTITDLKFIYKHSEAGAAENISIQLVNVNPTKYIVDVNSSRHFFLILGESFDPNWAAYIDDKIVTEHFIANGYANSWYISKTGSFQVVLEFLPQKLFYIGSGISLITFIICLACIRKKSRRNVKRTNSPAYGKRSKRAEDKVEVPKELLSVVEAGYCSLFETIVERMFLNLPLMVFFKSPQHLIYRSRTIRKVEGLPHHWYREPYEL